MSKLLSMVAALFFGIALAESPFIESDIFGPINAEQRAEPKIEISIKSPEGDIYFGDEVTLECSVDGGDITGYIIDWQYCDSPDTDEFIDLDCHELLYTFVITSENAGYCYRVVISEK